MDLIGKLNNDIVLVAEGYNFALERRGYLQAGSFVPSAVLDHPEVVKELHRERLRAGSDVLEAVTYYAHREKLKLVGLEDKAEELNKQAVRLAKEVAKEGRDKYSINVLVAGNISNTGVYDPDNPETSNVVRLIYEEQVRWSKEEGVDFIIAETNEYLGEALIGLEVIKKQGLQAVVTMTPLMALTWDQFSFSEAGHILEENGADVVGLNCSSGPATMYRIIEKVRERKLMFMLPLCHFHLELANTLS